MRDYEEPPIFLANNQRMEITMALEKHIYGWLENYSRTENIGDRADLKAVSITSGGWSQGRRTGHKFRTMGA